MHKSVTDYLISSKTDSGKAYDLYSPQKKFHQMIATGTLDVLDQKLSDNLILVNNFIQSEKIDVRNGKGKEALEQKCLEEVIYSLAAWESHLDLSEMSENLEQKRTVMIFLVV